MKKILCTFALVFMATMLCMASERNTNTLKNDGGRISLSQMRAIPRPASLKAPEKIQFSREQVKNAIRKAPVDGACDIYGFLIYDYRFTTNGIIKFSSEKPQDYQLVKDYGRRPADSYFICSATFVGKELYAYCCLYYATGAYVPLAYGVIDPATGVFTKKKDIPVGTATMFNDMTYDVQRHDIRCPNR